MLKMYTIDGKWIILDGDRIVIFGKAYDAWRFVFLLRGIRKKVEMPPRSLYPVKTLDPREEGGKKNVTFRLHT